MGAGTRRYTPKRYPRGRAAKRASRPVLPHEVLHIDPPHAFRSVQRSRDAIRGVNVDPPAEGRIDCAICYPDSLMEHINCVWAMYRSVKRYIFRHTYMGMAIPYFINASDFSNLPQASPGQVVYLGCTLFRGVMDSRRPQGRRRAEGERAESRLEHAVSMRGPGFRRVQLRSCAA